jgi:hypothetical protein
MASITAGVLGLTTATATVAQGATGWTVYPVSGTLPSYSYTTAAFARTDTDAWAAGKAEEANSTPGEVAVVDVPFVLHWNGTSWSPVPIPAPSPATDPYSSLDAVGASSATDAWAVGYQTAAGKHAVTTSLYEHWNGTAWSIVAGPNIGLVSSVIDFSPTDAWAFSGSAAEQWNGTAWNPVTVPVLPHSVSANGPDDIWGINGTTAIHYNGTDWTSTTLPASGSVNFDAPSVLSPTDVWASGCDGSGCAVPVVDHYNGTSWQAVPLPSSFSSYSLYGIIAQSDTDVWIFGWNTSGLATGQLLLAQWNGTSWSASPSPVPASTDPFIDGGSGSPGHVWVVGGYINNGIVQPLILGNP